MSGDPTPDHADGPDGGRTEGLDPRLAELAERAVTDFRQWLRDYLSDAPEVDLGPEDDPEPLDVATVLRLFVGLQQEVRQQTRAVRSALEQLDGGAKSEPESTPDAGPLLKPLLEVRDALALSLGRAGRLREEVLPRLAALGRQDRPGFWGRLFRAEPARPGMAESDFVRQSVEGFLTGYEMSLARLDTLLSGQGLEAIPAVGRPFDPERMEVVELAPASEAPSGHVVEEVRRGYLRGGRVFRFALVKVAK